TAIAAVPAAADGSNGPPNPAYWVNSGQSIRTANALAAQVTKNTADITTVDGKTSATAAQLQAVQAQYRADSGEGDLLDAIRGWDSAASAAQEVKVRAEEDFAQAQRTTTLQARVGTNEARIATVETTTATDREATAQQISTLTASVGTNQAAIRSEANARANADGALSTKLDQVQVTANNASAAVQTVSSAQATTDGKLTTMWSVKMQLTQDGRYVAAGIGLGIENTAAGLQSQFLVSADRFAIIGTMAGGGTYTPFVVQGGQVFVNQAFIQDASIGVAKLTQSLQSSNYVAGQQGLKINFVTGEFEFNSATGDGGRQTINNAGGKVYDEKQLKRYQWGNLAV
ncbi:DUF1983 domain-containing protein, partial [Pseudomonas amygdali]|uniref:DUF1983 domain-containing protein n=1 Tax=Pseudomonas amygdali TaxID=47877 RepID=UPI0011C3D16C